VVTPLVATVRAGETLKLTATAASHDRGVVRQIAVTWLSSDTDIASVSSTGLLRGVRPGRTEITVRWGTSRAVVGVTVLKGEPRPIACLSIIPKDGCQ
jgi:alpha-amylase